MKIGYLNTQMEHEMELSDIEERKFYNADIIFHMKWQITAWDELSSDTKKDVTANVTEDDDRRSAAVEANGAQVQSKPSKRNPL